MEITERISLETIDRIPTVDHSTGSRNIIGILSSKLMYALYMLGIYGSTTFHFLSNELPLLSNQEIHFQSGTITRKVELVSLPYVTEISCVSYNLHICNAI